MKGVDAVVHSAGAVKVDAPRNGGGVTGGTAVLLPIAGVASLAFASLSRRFCALGAFAALSTSSRSSLSPGGS